MIQPNKMQKCDSNQRISKNTADEISIYDPTSLCESHPLTNPFSNNWREYENATPSFKEEKIE